jgi:malonyl-ACP decarboxylase
MSLVISGVGITTPLGQGSASVLAALLSGTTAFGLMRRPGRQNQDSQFLGAEIRALPPLTQAASNAPRNASWSSQVALTTLAEAWLDAKLDELDATRIGLVVGGSNLQQRELVLIQDAYRERFEFLRPPYGQLFMDTDIAAICTECFGIRGMTQTVGGASASGHLAIVEAAKAVACGQVDACIALGALLDVSYWECQGLRALGAMGSDRFANEPNRACRPFDQLHDGFIYGENCGAVVVETRERARSTPYAVISGWSYLSDGHRGPQPSLDGEVAAIVRALKMASTAPEEIDYINPHGTGSPLGDQIELQALRASGLSRARINTTKSLLGHGLSAAGAVETIATVLQMRSGMLHPSRNLDEPIDTSFAWVLNSPEQHEMRKALNLSLGFGGINSAICLSSCTN